jgi:hypothetical protein
MDFPMSAPDSEDFDFPDFPVDPNLLDNPSWGLPSTSDYPQSNQFLAQPSHNSQYPAPSHYGYQTPAYLNGNSQPSPYLDQSLYGNQFQTSSHAGSVGNSQFDMNYISTPPRPQQLSQFSYSSPSLNPASTVSLQDLQRNTSIVSQVQRNGPLTLSQGAGISPLADAGRQQQSWSHDTTGGYGANPLRNTNAVFSQQSVAQPGNVSYPSFGTFGAPPSGPPRSTNTPLQPQLSQPQPSQRSTPASFGVRVTHQPELSAQSSYTYRKTHGAPFVIVDEDYQDLELKLPKSKHTPRFTEDLVQQEYTTNGSLVTVKPPTPKIAKVKKEKTPTAGKMFFRSIRVA